LPVKSGRIIKVAGDPGVRYREARFLPDGKHVVALSTESGETEFWKYPANGVGAPEQWTRNSQVLRWDGISSPDGKWLGASGQGSAALDLRHRTKQDKRIAQSRFGDFDNLEWSADSRWLAFTQTAANQFLQISVFNVDSGTVQSITSDRYNSVSPAWSADGNWLYFLSDRSLKTTVESPWARGSPNRIAIARSKSTNSPWSQVCVLPSCRRMNCIRTRRRRPMTSRCKDRRCKERRGPRRPPPRAPSYRLENPQEGADRLQRLAVAAGRKCRRARQL